jgi:hypothetical protein
MSSPLSNAIAGLCSSDLSKRIAAANEIYGLGRSLADRATQGWRNNAKFSELLGADPTVTVGLAVERDTFTRIRNANGAPRLAQVPPDQDAEEFELHFPGKISLDILTTREPEGTGAIARYLAKLGEGIQQVEYRCTDLERATAVLRQELAVTPVYPESRAGADGTRVNFFLVPAPGAGKVLIELYQLPEMEP